ncbi:hypothetical protein FACS1894154_01570 [Betaproteobacteria bacterium]|nr:hypothetical protein FACS1894154_01570 [Betaproteobacteria bacterium]
MSFTRHQAVGAYQRWVPPAFDAPPPEPEPEPAPADEPAPPAPPTPEAAPPAPAPEPPPAVHLPTVDEIEQIHDEARSSGLASGFSEGREAGYTEGFEAGQNAGREAGFAEGSQTGLEEGRQNGYAAGKIAAVKEIARLRELYVNVERTMTRLDDEVGEELMTLAIEIARKVVQHTLAMTPEALREVVRGALSQLPQGKAEIHLNPDDLALIRKHLDETASTPENYIVVADDTVSAGGCRIETAGAQVDATMETRWQRVLESLGSKSPWIAQARVAPAETASAPQPEPEPTPEPAPASVPERDPEFLHAQRHFIR